MASATCGSRPSRCPVGFGQVRTATWLPVLVMVTGYTRWLSARLIPSRVAEDLFAGWWQLISQLGAVPKVLVWDGSGAVGQRRRRQADRAAMPPLPPVAPPTGWRSSLRLPRDHYIRLDSNDYSVHPTAVGRRVEVAADLECVRVCCDGQLVADHQRCWARHQTISDPAHLQAAARLRHQRTVLAPRSSDAGEVQLRRLTDYDAAFAVDDGQGVA